MKHLKTEKLKPIIYHLSLGTHQHRNAAAWEYFFGEYLPDNELWQKTGFCFGKTESRSRSHQTTHIPSLIAGPGGGPDEALLYKLML